MLDSSIIIQLPVSTILNIELNASLKPLSWESETLRYIIIMQWVENMCHFNGNLITGSLSGVEMHRSY